jgi:hypothetical protein
LSTLLQLVEQPLKTGVLPFKISTDLSSRLQLGIQRFEMAALFFTLARSATTRLLLWVDLADLAVFQKLPVQEFS